MKKIMVIEVQVAVAVKPEDDFAKVNAKVSSAALAMKAELGEVEAFTIASREVAVSETKE